MINIFFSVLPLSVSLGWFVAFAARYRKADSAQCLAWILEACDEYRRRPHPHHNNITGIVEA